MLTSAYHIFITHDCGAKFKKHFEISESVSVCKLNVNHYLGKIQIKNKNLDRILHKMGDFGWAKNSILDNIFPF